MNMVLKLSTEPLAKLATPCAFGPTTRMPCALASSTMRRLRALSFLAHLGEARRHDDRHRNAASRALGDGVDGLGAFDRDDRGLGLLGTSSMPAKQRKPCTSLRAGFTGKIFP